MDSFFGIGLPELVLILLLAGLVMGPHRIRQFARIFGKVTAQLQRVSREFARQLNSELDAVDSGEMKNVLGDMRSLQDEVEALRRELSQVPKSFRDVTDSVASEGKAAISAGEEALQGSSPSQTKSELSEVGDDQPEDVPDPESPAQPPLPKPLDVPEDPES
jgi:Sec-independent protein translocase protein TatA